MTIVSGYDCMWTSVGTDQAFICSHGIRMEAKMLVSTPVEDMVSWVAEQHTAYRLIESVEVK